MRYPFIAGIAMAGQLLSLGLAFLFHFIMARWLGVALYGELGIFLGIFTLLFYPVIGVQAVLMREVAQLHAESKLANIYWLIIHYFRQSLVITLPFLALALLALYLVGLLFHPFEILLLLLSVPMFYAIFVFNSYFQGTQQPLQFASLLVSIDFLRLAVAVILVGAG